MTERKISPGHIRFKPTSGCKGTRRFRPGGKDSACADRDCTIPRHSHWRVTCTVKGHRHWAFAVTEYEPRQKARPYTSKGYATKAEAQRALDQWRADFDTRPEREAEEHARRAAEQASPRFREWAETWLHRKVTDREHHDNTASQAGPFLRRILDLEIEHDGALVQYGDLRLADMTAADTRAILEADAEHRGRPYMSYATKGLWSYLGGCLREAVEWGKAAPDVVSTRRVKPPTNAKIRDGKPHRDDYGKWEVEDARRFLAYVESDESGLDLRWAALFRLALDMGLRREELCGLRWSDVDFTTGQVWVRRVRAVPTGQVPGCSGVVEREATKTEAGYRSWVVTERTVTALRQWRAEQDDLLLSLGVAPKADGYVFTSPEHADKPINPRRVSETCRAAIKAATVPAATLHYLRHFAAVFALRAGMTIEEVAKMLGHSDPAITTKHYANYVTMESQHEAARRREKVLAL
jgi:integrase